MLFNKKAAMEMSVGTIVTIVLVIAFLVVGIIFLTQIREVGVNAIKGVDDAIRGEIESLFAGNANQRVVVYPKDRQIKIEKGTSEWGFAFWIRNLDPSEGAFSYDVTAQEVEPCDLRLSEAESLIVAGKSLNNINIASGSIMDHENFVIFDIPESVPLCHITYSIDVRKDGQIYGSSIPIYLEILPE